MTIESALRNNRKKYVSTGILNSLIKRYHPLQSDVIDLSVLLELNPSGIILNSALVYGNLDEALNAVNKVRRNVEKRDDICDR